MKKFILWLARPIIIKKLNEKSFGDQFINTVLEALGLPECGLPKYHNPPPPPPKPKDKHDAFEALRKSYIPFDEILRMIDCATKKNMTILPYVLISHETVERLRQLGYSVRENLGGGYGIPAGVSTIRWDCPGKNEKKNNSRSMYY